MGLQAQTVIYSQTSLTGSTGYTPGLFDQFGLLAGPNFQRMDFYTIIVNNTGLDLQVNRAILFGTINTASTAVLVPTIIGSANFIPDILVPDMDPNHILAMATIPVSVPGSGTDCITSTSGFTGCPITISFSPGVMIPAGGQFAFGFISPLTQTVDAALFGTDTLPNTLSSTTPQYYTGFYYTTSAGDLGLANGNHYLVLEAESVGDKDGDAVPDNQDQCPNTVPGSIIDGRGCSINQLAPCDGPLLGGKWKNHGHYISTITKIANAFLAAGLITEEKKDEIISTEARSECGTK